MNKKTKKRPGKLVISHVHESSVKACCLRSEDPAHELSQNAGANDLKEPLSYKRPLIISRSSPVFPAIRSGL